jgi:hypothetical protein
MNLHYRKCPKCGYERQLTDTVPAGQCPGCGLIFEKWLRQRLRPPPVAPAHRTGRLVSAILERLLTDAARVDVAHVWGRVLLYVLFVVWGLGFIAMDYRELSGGLPQISGSFLHGVNLVFHEAGHVLFRPFGDFLTVLGGSLNQLLMPALAIWVFLRQRDPFAASLGLWWFGQSLLDLAPYIYDARAGEMLLLGGVTGRDVPGYHDWENLLGRFGALAYDHALAGWTYGLGVLAILLAWIYGGAVLWRQWRRRCG